MERCLRWKPQTHQDSMKAKGAGMSRATSATRVIVNPEIKDWASLYSLELQCKEEQFPPDYYFTPLPLCNFRCNPEKVPDCYKTIEGDNVLVLDPSLSVANDVNCVEEDVVLEGWKPCKLGNHQVLCDAQYTEDESGKVTSAAYGVDLKTDEGDVLSWAHGPPERLYKGVRVHEIYAALMGVTLSDELTRLHLKYDLSEEEKKLCDIQHLEIVSDNKEAIDIMEEMRDERSDISKQLDSKSGKASDEIKVLRMLRDKIRETFGFEKVSFRHLVREGNFFADSLGRRYSLCHTTKTFKDDGFFIPGLLYFEFRDKKSNPNNQKADRQTFAKHHYIRFKLRADSPLFFVREKFWYLSGYTHGKGGGRRLRDDSILTGGNAGSQVKGGHDLKQVSTLAEYKPFQLEEKKPVVNPMSEEQKLAREKQIEERKLAIAKQFVSLKAIGKKKEEELQLSMKKKRSHSKEQKDEKLQVPLQEFVKPVEKESEPPALLHEGWLAAAKKGGSQQQQKQQKQQQKKIQWG